MNSVVGAITRRLGTSESYIMDLRILVLPILRIQYIAFGNLLFINKGVCKTT